MPVIKLDRLDEHAGLLAHHWAEAGDALRSVARRIAAFHAGLEADDRAIEVASVDAERRRWVANLEEMSGLEIFESAALDHIGTEMARYLGMFGSPEYHLREDATEAP